MLVCAWFAAATYAPWALLHGTVSTVWRCRAPRIFILFSEVLVTLTVKFKKITLRSSDIRHDFGNAAHNYKFTL